MTGQLVHIINRNNEAIRNEFDYLFDDVYNRLTKSLYAPSGSVKAHLGEYVNFQTDYIQVNNKDSLARCMEGIDHNILGKRFKDDETNDGTKIYTSDTYDTYAHNASMIIYKNNKSVYQILSELENSLDSLTNGGTPSTSRAMRMSMQDLDAAVDIAYGDSWTSVEQVQVQSYTLLEDNYYTATALQKSRLKLPKFQLYDVKNNNRLAYYAQSPIVTITDKYKNTIEGFVGKTTELKFEDTDTNEFYYVLLSRQNNSYLKLSKDKLVRVTLVCVNRTEEFGAEWEVKSYSVRNANDIDII